MYRIQFVENTTNKNIVKILSNVKNNNKLQQIAK